MGNVRLYGATSGYTELAPPAVAPDGVLSLPSGVGTLLTAEGGKVLQIVRATDVTSRSTTSVTFVDATGMSVTITPTSVTSKIMIIATGLAGNNGSNSYSYYQITDSSNNAISGAESLALGDAASSNNRYSLVIIGWASPATLSAVTYKVRFRSDSGQATLLQNNNATGQLYAIEVSA